MKTTKKPYHSPQTLLGIILTFAIIGGSIWFMRLPIPTTRQQNLEDRMSDEKKRKHRQDFYESVLQPILDGIIYERMAYRSINERHHALTGVITNHYKQPFIDLEIAHEHNKDSEVNHLLGQCYIADNGIPTVRLYVPQTIRLYNALAKTGHPQWQPQFAIGIAFAFLHELDHLALALVFTNSPTLMASAEFLDSECKAYARTCEHTLRPLVEEYQFPLSSYHQSMYDAWVRSERKETNVLWREAIRKMHE